MCYNNITRASISGLSIEEITMLNTTKQCTSCYENQDITDFGKRRENTDGLNSMCKKCCVIKSLNYSRTRKGIITTIYASQIGRSKKDTIKQVSYTKKEFSEWILSNDSFELLYLNWIKSGYDKYMKPSVDRLDDYKGYSLDNIQLTTWRENDKKGSRDRLSGRNTKLSKAVLQFSLDNEFIKEHHSLSEAGRDNGLNFKNIHQAITGRRGCKQSGGFIWKYKET